MTLNGSQTCFFPNKLFKFDQILTCIWSGSCVIERSSWPFGVVSDLVGKPHMSSWSHLPTDMIQIVQWSHLKVSHVMLVNVHVTMLSFIFLARTISKHLVCYIQCVCLAWEFAWKPKKMTNIFIVFLKLSTRKSRTGGSICRCIIPCWLLVHRLKSRGEFCLKWVYNEKTELHRRDTRRWGA